MSSMKKSLALASIASVNLNTSSQVEESKFALVLSIRNIQRDASLRRQSFMRAPWWESQRRPVQTIFRHPVESVKGSDVTMTRIFSVRTAPVMMSAITKP